MSNDDKEDAVEAGEGAVSEQSLTADSSYEESLDESDAPEEATVAKETHSGSKVAAIVLFLLIVLVAAAAYYWHQNIYMAERRIVLNELESVSASQEQLAASVDAATASIEAVAGDAQSSSGQFTAMSSSINQAQAEIANVKKSQSDLQASVSALYEKESQTSVDWLLAETEYLVLAATQRLALERDVATAIAALRAADQRIRSADHPDLIVVRDQLIKDITALEGVAKPDLEGWAIYFAKTIDQVDSLPTKPIDTEITPFNEVREGDYGAEDWRRFGLAIWSDLVDLVEVKDAELPDSVLFDPELRYFLRQNLTLELSSARLAVLRRDKENLAASAALIKKQLNTYYDTDNAAVTSIIARLDEAEKLELSPSLPNIAASLDIVRKQRANKASTGSAQ